MIIKKDKIKISAAEIINVLVSVLFLIGIRSWFDVCPVMSEMTMSCHWAGEVLKAISIVLLVIFLIHVFVPDEKIKIGMDMASVCILVMTLFIPGTVISLCQNPMMQCRSVTVPWTLIILIVQAAACVIDMIIYASELSKLKHRRKDNA